MDSAHIPPFREAAWYRGRPSNDDFLPFFSCEAVGDVLLETARSHPKCNFLVLCGHTHGGGEIEVAENLRVLTGTTGLWSDVQTTVVKAARHGHAGRVNWCSSGNKYSIVRPSFEARWP